MLISINQWAEELQYIKNAVIELDASIERKEFFSICDGVFQNSVYFENRIESLDQLADFAGEWAYDNRKDLPTIAVHVKPNLPTLSQQCDLASAVEGMRKRLIYKMIGNGELIEASEALYHWRFYLVLGQAE
ncbi:hypothetical protein [Woodsholea maritima]|uniref:hypothetical protein n=1 Tax=Woodsholea maritima TaxID=240237 RepID=UPI0003732AD2|nr:hypothetical protein [Woodsholea maritima]